MSAQVLELIIFAGIAFFIINRLISHLGSTSEDDPTKNKSFFGENKSNILKDVTYTGEATQSLKSKFLRSNKIELNGLVVAENKIAVEEGLSDMLQKLPSFNVAKFITSAKSAFKMIIESVQNNDAELTELVDKRYIDGFKSIAISYGDFIDDNNKLSAHISEIYTFGNNVFVKILFAGKNITSKIKDLHEEWTFSKSVISSNPAWYLTNIDRPQ